MTREHAKKMAEPSLEAQRQKRYRTKRNAKMAALTAALDWALAEIEGRTRYHPTCIYTAEEQRSDAISRAKQALNG